MRRFAELPIYFTVGYELHRRGDLRYEKNYYPFSEICADYAL